MAHDRLTGTLSDRYRIERELGRGGMAVVYLAQDLSDGGPVAVKVLRREITGIFGSGRFGRERGGSGGGLPGGDRRERRCG